MSTIFTNKNPSKSSPAKGPGRTVVGDEDKIKENQDVPGQDTLIEQAETRVDQANTRTDEANTRTEQANTRTEQANTRTEKAETRTEQAETRTEQAKTRTEQAEMRTEEAEARSVEAILSSELRYRRLFETAQDGILILDAETGQVVDANPVMKELLGYSQEEFLGRKLWEIGPFKGSAASKVAFAELQREDRPRCEGLPLETKDGRRVEVEFISNAYLVGTKRLIQCNVRDITERKLAERATSRLAAIIESSNEAIIGKDLNSIVTSWNKGAETIFGYAAGEMVGTSILRLIPNDLRDEENQLLAKIKRGESVVHFESLRQTKSGEMINVSITASPIKDATGTIIGVSKMARDITKLKRTEDQLKTSFKEIGDLKAALDEHAIVAMTNPQGKITYVNDKFCTISKYSREELLGQDHRIINSGYHSKQFMRDLWTTIARGDVWHGEIKNRAKDGSNYWVDATILPFLGEDGKPRQYVAIRTDITERKRAEEEIRSLNAGLEQRVAERTIELQSAKEQAESADQMKSEFLANMSHELRTPLNGIIGFSEFLIDGKTGTLTPKQKEYVTDIFDSGRHLLQLINDVLDLAKVEAGKMDLRPEAFSVGKAIKEVCSVVGPMAQQKKVAINSEIAPSADEVTLDRRKLKQVLFNLLSNAVKFTDEGGRVNIVADLCDETHLRLQVQDTGIGIEPEDLAKLFTEFRQLDTGLARSHQGTGLGLALTKKIVKFQQGTIEVQSEPGKGSTFIVILPRVSERKIA